MFLCHNNITYRFVVDHSFIEKVIVTPKDKKDNLPEWQLVMKTYRMKEDNCDLLWTSPSVKQYIKTNFGDDQNDDRKEMIAILFDLIINIDSSVEDLPIMLSLKKCASKIGYKNFLVTTEKETMERVFKNCSFKVENSDTILNLIQKVIQDSKMGGIS